MNNKQLIEKVESICAHRLVSDAHIGGKWIIWNCDLSPQTMAKFIDRVKQQTSQPAFFRGGRFGVLATE